MKEPDMKFICRTLGEIYSVVYNFPISFKYDEWKKEVTFILGDFNYVIDVKDDIFEKKIKDMFNVFISK